VDSAAAWRCGVAIVRAAAASAPAPASSSSSSSAAAAASASASASASAAASDPDSAAARLRKKLGVFQFDMLCANKRRKEVNSRVRAVNGSLFVGDVDVTAASFLFNDDGMGSVDLSAESVVGSFVDSVEYDDDCNSVVCLELVEGVVFHQTATSITVLCQYGQFSSPVDNVSVISFFDGGDDPVPLSERPELDVMFMRVLFVPSVAWSAERGEIAREAKWARIYPSTHRAKIAMDDKRRVFAVFKHEGETVRCDVLLPDINKARAAIDAGRTRVIMDVIYSTRRENHIVAKNMRLEED
jgi:hypothetical protein